MLDSFWKRVPKDHSFEQIVLLALETIMIDLSKLDAAVAANTKAVADIEAAFAALNTGSIQTAVNTAAAQIETNNVALAGLVPPPVTPAST